MVVCVTCYCAGLLSTHPLAGTEAPISTQRSKSGRPGMKAPDFMRLLYFKWLCRIMEV